MSPRPTPLLHPSLLLQHPARGQAWQERQGPEGSGAGQSRGEPREARERPTEQDQQPMVIGLTGLEPSDNTRPYQNQLVNCDRLV